MANSVPIIVLVKIFSPLDLRDINSLHMTGGPFTRLMRPLDLIWATLVADLADPARRRHKRLSKAAPTLV
jgi:hypothetical protein